MAELIADLDPAISGTRRPDWRTRSGSPSRQRLRQRSGDALPPGRINHPRRGRRGGLHSGPGWGISVIEITQDHVDEIIAHAREDFPNECCGLLFEPDASPTAPPHGERRAQPPELPGWTAKRCSRRSNSIDRVGLDLVGIYHSHTHSPAQPSRTDINLAGYPDAHYLIVSLANAQHPDLRAFTIVNGDVIEQEVTIR